MKNTEKIIAIVDDEEDIVELISTHVEKAGFKPEGFEDGTSFLKYLEKHRPELVILDIMLPGIDGFEVCKYLKSNEKYAEIPVIMLTAKSDEIDKVLGLEIGADDYITKPFSPRELVARIKAVLRRHEIKEKEKKREIAGLITIIPDKYEVYVENKKVNLTTTEFKILDILSSRKGFVYSRDKLLDYLWGQEKAVLDRTIDVHINNLREKLGKAGKLIKNVRGIGYKLEED